MNTYEKRFQELNEDMQRIEASRVRKPSEFGITYEEVDIEELNKWRLKVKALINNLCGIESEYYKAIIEAEKPETMMHTSYEIFKRIKAVFCAIKDDYLNGYLDTYKSLVQAEVFAEQIEQARELFENGYILAAAITAGIILETKIREICISKGLAIGNLDKMNADLAKNGIYNTLVQKQITAIAAIRNSAAHGKYEDFTKEQVRNMIDQVEYLLTIL